MDEVFERLLSVSAEGLTYVGHIATSAKPGAPGKLKPKAWPSPCLPSSAAWLTRTCAGLSPETVSGAYAGNAA